MTGGTPIPILVKGEEAVILCMEDLKAAAGANLSQVVRGRSQLEMPSWKLMLLPAT